MITRQASRHAASRPDEFNDTTLTENEEASTLMVNQTPKVQN